jgi:hypothetical protein
MAASGGSDMSELEGKVEKNREDIVGILERLGGLESTVASTSGDAKDLKERVAALETISGEHG